jgi:hypothetical protein
MSRNYEIRALGFARASKKVFRFNCVCIGEVSPVNGWLTTRNGKVVFACVDSA